MKNLKKLFSLCLVLALCLGLGTIALAAPVSEATIDVSRTGSLDIYKYDFTNAAKDGVWDNSYVSTGVYDQTVNDTLGNAIRAGDTDNSGDLGNGETSYGYAIKGVEFTYLRVADIVQFTESAADGSTSNHVEVLYGIDKTNGSALLAAIGLADGAGRYENADNSDKLDSGNYYYQSDVLIDALRASLTANATTVKNALENYVKVGGGTALPLTDAYGHTSADGLPLGLYLVVETRVPEMVIDTTAPFFVSLPMTSVDGNNANDGGTRWMYDVTLYPKNLYRHPHPGKDPAGESERYRQKQWLQ
ncbi:MAG: pilin N-terminal domain-containing protein [Oscillospiraceae bacterium]